MKLYVFPFAPNPAKVLLYLAEKGIPEIERVPVSLMEGAQKSPEHLARNPLGKVPVLELDDGRYVTESLAIIEYLEERFPDPPLIGRSAEERALVRSRERELDIAVLMAGAGWVHATKSPLGLPPNPAVADDCHQRWAAALSRADAWLAENEFAAGPEFTIADCTLWAALRFQGFFGLEPADDLEQVHRWKAQVDARPSAQQV